MALQAEKLFGADAAEDGDHTVKCSIRQFTHTMADTDIPGLGEIVKIVTVGEVVSVGRTKQEDAAPIQIKIRGDNQSIKLA